MLSDMGVDHEVVGGELVVGAAKASAMKARKELTTLLSDAKDLNLSAKDSGLSQLIKRSAELLKKLPAPSEATIRKEIITIRDYVLDNNLATDKEEKKAWESITASELTPYYIRRLGGMLGELEASYELGNDEEFEAWEHKLVELAHAVKPVDAASVSAFLEAVESFLQVLKTKRIVRQDFNSWQWMLNDFKEQFAVVSASEVNAAAKKYKVLKPSEGLEAVNEDEQEDVFKPINLDTHVPNAKGMKNMLFKDSGRYIQYSDDEGRKVGRVFDCLPAGGMWEPWVDLGNGTYDVINPRYHRNIKCIPTPKSKVKASEVDAESLGVNPRVIYFSKLNLGKASKFVDAATKKLIKAAKDSKDIREVFKAVKAAIKSCTDAEVKKALKTSLTHLKKSPLVA